jgi:hypothetical protein
LWLAAYTVKHEPQIGLLSVVLQTYPGTTCSYNLTSCHGYGGQSPAFRRGDLGLIPNYSVRDFWWTKWYGDNFSPHYFDTSLSVPLYQCRCTSAAVPVLLYQCRCTSAAVPVPLYQCCLLSLLSPTLFVISIIRNVVK